MPTFQVIKSFEFRGMVRREGTILEASEKDVIEEIELGKHPDNGRPMSGLLNHCSPVDKEAEMLLGAGGFEVPEPEKPLTHEEEEQQKKEILAEMEKLGAFCNPAWKLTRMKKELTKAQKERPAEDIQRDRKPGRPVKI